MAELTFSPAGLEVLEDAPVRTYAEVRICEAEALARLIEFGPDDPLSFSRLKEMEEECLAAAVSLVEGHTPRMIEAVVFSKDDPDEDLEVWEREALFLLKRAGQVMIDSGKWPLLAAAADGPRPDSPEFDEALRQLVEEEG